MKPNVSSVSSVSPSMLQPYNPGRKSDGSFPSLTTFSDEKRLLTVGREALVSVARSGGIGRMLVAVHRHGFRTDYPVARNGGTSWDTPEMFSKRFKERAKRFILSA